MNITSWNYYWSLLEFTVHFTVNKIYFVCLSILDHRNWINWKRFRISHFVSQPSFLKIIAILVLINFRMSFIYERSLTKNCKWSLPEALCTTEALLKCNKNLDIIIFSQNRQKSERCLTQEAFSGGTISKKYEYLWLFMGIVVFIWYHFLQL